MMEQSFDGSKTIHIALSFDNNYVRQSAVLIKSILLSNADESFVFHIISDKTLTQLSHDELSDNTVTGKSKISFYNFDSSLFKDYPGSKYVTTSTFFRYMIPYLLPESIEKVLYLDSDMLVLDSVRELWETDMAGYSTAVALSTNHNHKIHLQRLGIDEKYGYSNIGMMLINLKFWREQEISKSVFDLVKEKPELLLILDQDALNMAIQKTKKILGPAWNILDPFLKDTSTWNLNTEYYGEIKQAAKNPKIIHFVGALKPWFTECSHPYRKCWDAVNSMLKMSSQFSKVNRYSAFEYIKYIIIRDHIVRRRIRLFKKEYYKIADIYKKRLINIQ
jgi:lipopolysaccharide biosynthesis glycosyltransferase